LSNRQIVAVCSLIQEIHGAAWSAYLTIIFGASGAGALAGGLAGTLAGLHGAIVLALAPALLTAAAVWPVGHR